MNIKEAKEEVINTIKAYRAKDDKGLPLIPFNKQRPVLLMGPPGIGKTQIMEQIASELKINLVSYTITHHTRQSAIGLPFIVKKDIQGKEYSVTEYTMSEIIGAVYDSIENTGISEGILFLDEINCVSETLSPMMLQFLQYKTFGQFKLPEGFVVVCAGNPPQYNKSVRDFDIVTLDRIKKIDITEDFGVWKEYGYENYIHGAILSYLEIKKKNFYSIKQELDGKTFVTARGWEDLSLCLKAYEKLDIKVSQGVIFEYLQDPVISRDFYEYYGLYFKYKDIYRITEILKGSIHENKYELRDAPFDEKLSIIGIIIEALTNELNKDSVENAFTFMEEIYGQNQEMVLFMTEINKNFPLLMFILENGSPKYKKYNELLLSDKKDARLRAEIQGM